MFSQQRVTMSLALIAVLTLILHPVAIRADDNDLPSYGEGCTLKCENGGLCTKGKADFGYHADYEIPGLEETHQDNMHCVCPTGFIGIKCGIKLKVCGDNQHTCYNGAECQKSIDDFGQEFYHCDCDTAKTDYTSTYAGEFCEHAATTFCAPERLGAARQHTFCTNGGACKDFVGAGQAHPGCDCSDQYEGPHCELAVKNLTTDPGHEAAKGAFIIFISVLGFGVLVAIVVEVVKLCRGVPFKFPEPGELDADGSTMPNPMDPENADEEEVEDKVFETEGENQLTETLT